MFSRVQIFYLRPLTIDNLEKTWASVDSISSNVSMRILNENILYIQVYIFNTEYVIDIERSKKYLRPWKLEYNRDLGDKQSAFAVLKK